jgi:hypothetical protein
VLRVRRNWADFSQPVNELYQIADHPALSPDFAIVNGGSKRRIILADLVSPRGKPAENTRHLSPQDGVGRLGRGLVWLIPPTAYGFLMISPNLHDIWAMFFLILSQYLKLVLLM